MKENSKPLFYLLLGAAAGAAIGFYLASDDKEKLLGDLKHTAGKIKDELENEIEKGKEVVNDLKNKVSDLLNKT